MCTFVETPDVRVLIDAGVALGFRFGKFPHPSEYQARNLCRKRIREFARKADLIVASHYHNDHHTPNYTETVYVGSSPEESEEIYKDKLVVAKDIRNSINFSQRRRGWIFQQFVKKIGGTWKVADGKAFEYGATKVAFSIPVPHGGEESELGWVVMTTVDSGEDRLLHSSDVQGPISGQTARLIVSAKPDKVVLGGPPVYLEGVKVDKQLIRKGLENAARIAGAVPAVIVEHHLLRSEDWKDRAKVVFQAADQKHHTVTTGAESGGMELQLLEATRSRLYEEDPPSDEFLEWCRMRREKQRTQPPPV
jgi:predicted metallo-beta-lactamase superfamily hydrolase